MPKSSGSTELNRGQKILAAIHKVLQRCEDIGEKVGYPGEGGERRFRAWLSSDLLQDVLLWPAKNVVVGERFDLLLLSDEHHALATIETKTPYHKASKKEKADFEKRLDGFPTLRTAYFTNGSEWERLDIVVSGAELRILERDRLDIENASPALAERFFAPLRYKASDELPVGQVYHVNRDNPFIEGTLTRLTSDLEDIISESTLLFRQMFYGLREGKAGQQAQDVTKAVYSQWCGKSLRITPQVAAEHLIAVFKDEGANARNINSTLSELGLDNDALPTVTEAILSLSPARRSDAEALIDCLWPVFGPSVDQLCAQTAHVLLARTLLYRVGEDEKVFTRRLSGAELNKQLESPSSTITGRKFPGTDLMESVRTEMQGFLPTVYLRGEFDWWAVLPEKRAALNTSQRAWLLQFDEELERLSKLMLRRLSHYLFESVDVDVWRNIYEHYLPEDERQRLGGFYTPEQLVNLVLDIEGYKSDKVGLCQLSYIDPACGSGAFVTTALGRLIAHLATDMPCHKDLIKKGDPDWKVAEHKLKLVAKRVHAIDLHPFASFLTTLNVLFMVLPLYVVARKKDPDFTIDLHIFSADGLERPDKKTEDQMHMFVQMNSRIQLSADSYQRYRDIMDDKFDRVFGNPPWGGVLKGSLAPVYDNAKKKHFALVFPSAAKGKYDVYGLFMERSLQLLNKGGRFALLTQDTYLDKEWAKGLRKLLSEEARLGAIVDLNPFGQLFFKAMNAPCVTVADNTLENVKGDCLCVTTQNPEDNVFRKMKTPERRAQVTETVKQVISDLGKNKRAKCSFSSGARIALATLRSTAKDRWDLSGQASPEDFPEGWFSAAELLEMRQGVTPGGFLEIFLMEQKKAELLELEDDLVHEAIKSKQLVKWKVDWKEQVLLYPYHVKGKKAEPAFSIDWDSIEDSKLKATLLQVKIEDALDSISKLILGNLISSGRQGLTRNRC
jgi:hypothetical protein